MLCRIAHCPKFEAGEVCEAKGVQFLHFQAPGPFNARNKQICRPALTGTCTWGEKCKTPHATRRGDGLWELNGIVFTHKLLLPKPKPCGEVNAANTALSLDAVEPVPCDGVVEQSPASPDVVAPAPAPPARRPRGPKPVKSQEKRAPRVPEPAAPAPQIQKPQSFAERARALKALHSKDPTGFDSDALDALKMEIDMMMLDANAALKVIRAVQASQLDL